MIKKSKTNFSLPLILVVTAFLTTSCGIPAEVREAMEVVPENTQVRQGGFELKCQTHSVPYWVNVGISAIVAGPGNFGQQFVVQRIVSAVTWKTCWLEGTLDLSRYGADPIELDRSWRISGSQESVAWTEWQTCADRGLSARVSAIFSHSGGSPNMEIITPAFCW